MLSVNVELNLHCLLPALPRFPATTELLIDAVTELPMTSPLVSLIPSLLAMVLPAIDNLDLLLLLAPQTKTPPKNSGVGIT